MTFSMSEAEVVSAYTWQKAHKETCKEFERDGLGAIGESCFSYEFHSTSLGYTVSTNCRCGSKQNITDYSDW